MNETRRSTGRLPAASLALAALALLALLAACAGAPRAADATPAGSGDLGVVVGRASGTLTVVDTSAKAALGTIAELGDLSHASVVYARDGARA
jgi:protein NirF